jgi:hypothetical protein
MRIRKRQAVPRTLPTIMEVLERPPPPLAFVSAASEPLAVGSAGIEVLEAGTVVGNALGIEIGGPVTGVCVVLSSLRIKFKL